MKNKCFTACEAGWYVIFECIAQSLQALERYGYQMAKYPINKKGEESLTRLQKDLSDLCTEIINKGVALRQEVQEAGKDLGHYEEDILCLVQEVAELMENGQDSVQILCNLLKTKIEKIQRLLHTDVISEKSSSSWKSESTAYAMKETAAGPTPEGLNQYVCSLNEYVLNAMQISDSNKERECRLQVAWDVKEKLQEVEQYIADMYHNGHGQENSFGQLLINYQELRTNVDNLLAEAEGSGNIAAAAMGGLFHASFEEGEEQMVLGKRHR